MILMDAKRGATPETKEQCPQESQKRGKRDKEGCDSKRGWRTGSKFERDDTSAQRDEQCKWTINRPLVRLVVYQRVYHR